MTDNEEPTIEVMLSIYSGRPNPMWTIRERRAEELSNLLEISGKPLGDAVERPGLGYRGFIVTNRGRLAGVPYRLHVYGGSIAVFDAPAERGGRPVTPRYYRDAHGLESWLLAQADEHGHAREIAAMGGPSLPGLKRG